MVSHPTRSRDRVALQRRRGREVRDFLFDEIGQRLAKEKVKLGVFVQMAEPDDDVSDASVTWPDSRAEIPFGTITLASRVDDQVPDLRKIIFDPLPRVDGIDSSGDPLTEVRADIYLLSGPQAARRLPRREARGLVPGAPPVHRMRSGFWINRALPRRSIPTLHTFEARLI